MKRALAITTLGLLLALTSLYGESASAGPPPIGVKPPPPPRPVLPPVRAPRQDLSFWGVDTNLQQSRNELQPAGPRNFRAHRRLKKTQSANSK
jgi:hypothetical protein